MTTTLDLNPGDTVRVPATLNSSEYRATVTAMEPWILTAGPQAGQQATEGRGKNARPLFTVKLADVERLAPPQRRIAVDSIDAHEDAKPTRHMAVTADAEWTVI